MTSTVADDRHQRDTTLLLDLPAELILSILQHLEAEDLGYVARTCRSLATLSYDERIWQPLVNRELLTVIDSPPQGCASFRELYLAHRPYWFLVRGRVWFGDAYPYGKLVATRYDAHSGCIMGYGVSAIKGERRMSFWEHDPEVLIHSFDPKIQLDREKPALMLSPNPLSSSTAATDFSQEISMSLSPSPIFHNPPLEEQEEDGPAPATLEPGLHTSFLLTRALPSAAISETTQVWPPLRIPSQSRARNLSESSFRSTGHAPDAISNVSRSSFRLRKWVEYAGRRDVGGRRGTRGAGGARNPTTTPEQHPVAIHNENDDSIFNITPRFHDNFIARNLGGLLGTRFRAPEFVTTFATVDPEAYTPTAERPWQGIFCGDYSGHGCEFLLVTQPEKGKERPLPTGMDWLRGWFAEGRHPRDEGSGSEDWDFLSALEEQIDGDEEGEGAAAAAAAEEMSNNINLLLGPADPVGGYEETMTTTTTSVTQQQQQERAALDLNQALASHNASSSPQASATLLPPSPQSSHSSFPDLPSGRLEAIKLTGDPNIPRGEYTFVAPEIGPKGFLRLADEEIFRGARVVRSAGHVAGRGFRNDQYSPSQLIMVSHDTLAQFWEGFGHISYYQRVDLEGLVRDG